MESNNTNFGIDMTREMLLVQLSRLSRSDPTLLQPVKPFVTSSCAEQPGTSTPLLPCIPPPPKSASSLSSSSTISVCGGGGMTSCSNGGGSVNNNSAAEIPTTSHFMPIATFAAQNQHLNAFVANHFMNNEASVFGLDLLSKQDSPLEIFRMTKNEPSSSSNSQPSTPMQIDRRTVPACAICGTDSTGIHFGVDACAACSAFFRRTVVLNKQYLCNKGGQCIIVKDGSVGQKCRACRFKKCLNAGMDKNSVQHRRDAIGRYSAGVKRELSPDVEMEKPPPKVYNGNCNEPSTSTSGNFVWTGQSPTNSIERINKNATINGFSQLPTQPKSILYELITRQQFLLDQRQLFYSDRNLSDWFCKREPDVGRQRLNELTDFSNCMYHLWKVEPRLAADFINRNRFLDLIPEDEKIRIYKNFVVIRQAVEEPYITWKHGGLENNWFVMPNNTYIDFTNPEKYFLNGALKDLKLDLDTARNLFLPSFMGAMDSVGGLMRNIEITDTEIIILLGLVMLDPAIAGIRETTRQQLRSIRDQLIHEVFLYYEDEEPSFEPEIRMADLFMILAAIKIHAIKTSENMHILRFFDLIPPDACFNQILETVQPQGDELKENLGVSRKDSDVSNAS